MERLNDEEQTLTQRKTISRVPPTQNKPENGLQDDDNKIKFYAVIVFRPKAKLDHCRDIDRIIQELKVITKLEIADKKYGKYLYLSASTDTLLRLADEAELMKETITGTMQKFNYASLNTFLLPGMSKDDIVRYCEGPFLIQDAIKPSLLPYIRTGFIEDIFPLHDLDYLKKFSLTWKRPHALPIEYIRNYFGSSIGMYFAFIDYYTKTLLLPVLFGILQCLLSVNLSIVCCFYVIWATIFLELWKRKCAGYSYHWGTIEMSSLDDKARLAYKGEIKPDPVTGKPSVQYPIRYTYLQMYCISYPVVVLCLLASAYFALYQFQIETEFLQEFGADSWILYVPCIVQSILMAIFSWAYEKLATFLTDIENHRTWAQYDRHRVNKLIMFEIVNNFFPLFYIAFVLQDFQQLHYQLIMQFFIFEVVCVVQDMAIPIALIWHYKWFNCQSSPLMKKAEDKADQKIQNKSHLSTQCDYEANLNHYESTYEDYLLICIQFGYMVLFAAITPLASVGVLLTNLLTIRLNLWKICTVFKRPFARRIKNIGAWQSAFELLSVIAVLSNCGILYLQQDLRSFVNNYFPDNSVWCFVLFEHFLLGSKFLLHKAIHEKPRWVRLALLKADHESSAAYKNLRAKKASKPWAKDAV